MIIFMFNRELRLFVASAEAGPLLCPILLHQGVGISRRLLDAAYGGLVRWETMEHRKGKVPKRNKDEADLTGKHAPTQIMSTNVQICMLQQVVVFAKWWALVENNEPVGLAPRFLLFVGSAGEPGDLPPHRIQSLRCFAVHEKKITAIVSLLGASRPFSSELPTSSWTVTDKQQNFLLNLRRVAALLSGDPTFGTLVRSAMRR